MELSRHYTPIDDDEEDKYKPKSATLDVLASTSVNIAHADFLLLLTPLRDIAMGETVFESILPYMYVSSSIDTQCWIDKEQSYLRGDGDYALQLLLKAYNLIIHNIREIVVDHDIATASHRFKRLLHSRWLLFALYLSICKTYMECKQLSTVLRRSVLSSVYSTSWVHVALVPVDAPHVRLSGKYGVVYPRASSCICVEHDLETMSFINMRVRKSWMPGELQAHNERILTALKV